MSDYISREELVKECIKYANHEHNVKFKPDVSERRKHDSDVAIYMCEYFKKFAQTLPLADVRENIHGEWIPKERTTECSVDIDIVCSECGNIGIEKYAYGYELNELPAEEMKDYIKKSNMNYCPCCGAKMDKTESEDK